MDSAKSNDSKQDSPEIDIPAVTEFEDYEDACGDVVYQVKARILNHAIQEIGMGKYQVLPTFRLLPVCNKSHFYHSQWHLFSVAGFGWLAYVLSLS